MQPQRHKADKLDESPKDYFLTTLKIREGKCMQINGKDVTSNLPLLPNVDHPYDHFVIYVELEYK